LLALKSVRPSLHYLDLDLTKSSSDPLALITPSSLTKFGKLETLKLTDTIFCNHGSLVFRTDSQATCLTDILPSTVRELTVRVDENTGAWPDIVHLGLCKADGHFHALQCVVVYVKGIGALSQNEAESWHVAVEDAFRGTSSKVFIEPTWREFGFESCLGILAGL